MAAKFEMTSDFSKVLADYEKLQSANVRLEQAVGKLVADSKKAETQTTGWFSGWKSELVGMVSGYFTLHAAIGMVTEAMAAQRRIAEEANRVQMTAADSQAEVIKNLGPVSTAHASAFLKSIDDIAKQAGAPQIAPVYQSAASTLSAIGGNEELTKTILANSIPLFRNKMDQLPAFAGSVGDLVGIMGDETKQGVQKAIGLTLQTLQQSRITRLDAFQNAAPAIAAVAAVDTGADRGRAVSEGGALFAAIGGSIKDPEGSLTKTATAMVATKLEDLLPEKDLIGGEGEIRRKGTGLKTLSERMRAVQADPELQREFFFGIKDEFQKAGFRAPIMPVIEQLLKDPNSEAAKRYKEASRAIRPDEKVFAQVLQNLENATPQLVSTGEQRKAAGSVEAFQMQNQAARTAAAKQIMNQSMDASLRGIGDYFLTYGSTWSAFKMRTSDGQSPESAAAAILEGRRNYIVGSNDPNEISRRTPQLPADDRKIVEMLDQQIKILQDLLAKNEAVERNTSQMADSQAKSGSSAANAASIGVQREGR